MRQEGGTPAPLIQSAAHSKIRAPASPHPLSKSPSSSPIQTARPAHNTRPHSLSLWWPPHTQPVSTSLLCKSQHAVKYSPLVLIGVHFFHWRAFAAANPWVCDRSCCCRRRAELVLACCPPRHSSPLEACLHKRITSSSANNARASHINTITVEVANQARSSTEYHNTHSITSILSTVGPLARLYPILSFGSHFRLAAACNCVCDSTAPSKARSANGAGRARCPGPMVFSRASSRGATQHASRSPARPPCITHTHSSIRSAN